MIAVVTITAEDVERLTKQNAQLLRALLSAKSEITALRKQLAESQQTEVAR